MSSREGLALAASVLMTASCAELPTVVENPVLVPFDDSEYVWQQTVEVVDQYFDIASENRISGRIETYPQVAATLLEPWHRDSVDAQDRLEATLQSIRKRAFITVTPVSNGHMVQIEVHKELENLPRPSNPKASDAVFRNDVTLEREHQIVGPLPVAQGWIDLGRDWKLESRMLRDLQARFGIQ